MCLPLSGTDCVALAPFFWIISLPVFGSFRGPEAVLRFSLLLIINNVICGAILPEMLVPIMPFLKSALFFLLISLPINLVPFVVVWVYDKLIWLSEPALLTLEAVQIVRVTTNLSQRLVQGIQDQPFLMKSAILVGSGFCYLLSIHIIIFLFSSGSTTQKWLIGVLIIIAVVILVATLLTEEGVITDAAVITLAMCLAMWVMRQEMYLVKYPVTEPNQWYRTATEEASFIQVLYTILTQQINKATQAVQFLRNMFSASFLLLIVLRVSSVLSTVWYMSKRNAQDVYLNEDSSRFFKWNAPTALKLAFIFVYTQLVVYNVKRSTGFIGYSRRYIDVFTKDVFHEVGFCRLLQLGVLSLTYLWRLYQADHLNYDYY
ncbi:uncharacterized protein LOC117122139 [Anneissia japonica]|uniref:uncharacterized protein LOC117122139 n=1 Tax=Anneissia japonica TaxID=1529436 RepID=UPI0014259FA1|nr:uncharacterized protein LOC117122139 [Anneissia japonica]